MCDILGSIEKEKKRTSRPKRGFDGSRLKLRRPRLPLTPNCEGEREREREREKERGIETGIEREMSYLTRGRNPKTHKLGRR